MPRMLRRAAVLGATAQVASNRGQARAQAGQQQDAAAAPPPHPPGWAGTDSLSSTSAEIRSREKTIPATAADPGVLSGLPA